MNKRKVGAAYEEAAKTYLQGKGIRIIEMNFRNRFGEIDIIGWDNTCLVFFEIKYRTNIKTGYPAEAVGYRKQKNICMVADYYRMLHHIGDFTPVRYDVIAICGKKLTWYQNAFFHISR